VRFDPREETKTLKKKMSKKTKLTKKKAKKQKKQNKNDKKTKRIIIYRLSMLPPSSFCPPCSEW